MTRVGISEPDRGFPSLELAFGFYLLLINTTRAFHDPSENHGAGNHIPSPIGWESHIDTGRVS